MKKLVALLLAVLMMATLCVGYAESADEFNPKDYKIGYVTGIKGNAVIQTIMMSYFNKIDELGYDPYCYAIDGNDVAQLVTTGISALANDLDALIVYKDISALALYQEAERLGVPTIAIHMPVAEDSGANCMADCLGDPTEIGYKGGMALGEELVRRGVESGSIAVTIGSLNNLTQANIDGFNQAMANFPQYKVLEVVQEGTDLAAALQYEAGILQANPDVVGVWAPNGGAATTWPQTLEAAGYEKGKVVVVGHDYTLTNLEAIRSGWTYACIAQPLVEEVQLAVEIFDNYFRTGEGPAEYYNAIEADLITQENVEEYQQLVNQVSEWFATYQG